MTVGVRIAPRGRGEVRASPEAGARRDALSSVVRATLRGQTEALMTARRLPMERQLFLEDIDSQPPKCRRQVD
jgi:hypothetical protein